VSDSGHPIPEIEAGHCECRTALRALHHAATDELKTEDWTKYRELVELLAGPVRA